jgi:hypothetical protein
MMGVVAVVAVVVVAVGGGVCIDAEWLEMVPHILDVCIHAIRAKDY